MQQHCCFFRGSIEAASGGGGSFPAACRQGFLQRERATITSQCFGNYSLVAFTGFQLLLAPIAHRCLHLLRAPLESTSILASTVHLSRLLVRLVITRAQRNERRNEARLGKDSVATNGKQRVGMESLVATSIEPRPDVAGPIIVFGVRWHVAPCFFVMYVLLV